MSSKHTLRRLVIASMRGDLSKVRNALSEFKTRFVCPHGQCLVQAAENGHLEIVDLLLSGQHLFDPNTSATDLLFHMCVRGQYAIVQRLMQDVRFDPSAVANACLANSLFYFSCRENYKDERGFSRKEQKQEHLQTIDLIYSDKRVYSSLKPWHCYDRAFTHIAMFKSRMLQICIAIQSLFLPDEQTLKIIDACICNTERRWAKIELIRTVKHFMN